MTPIHLNRLGIHLVYFSVALAATGHSMLALGFPGPAPGEAQGRIDGSTLVLENRVLAVQWEAAGGLRLTRVVDKLAGRSLEFGQAESFQIVVSDSPLPAARTIKASDLRTVSAPEVLKMEGRPDSVRLAERYGGRQLFARLVSPDGNLEVEWRAELRNGSNYIRQHLQLKVGREMLEIQEMVLLDLQTLRAEVVGTVDGSPVVVDNVFFGYEHPMSRSQVLEVSGRKSATHSLQLSTCGHAEAGRTPETQLGNGGGAGRSAATRFSLLPGARASTTLSSLPSSQQRRRYWDDLRKTARGESGRGEGVSATAGADLARDY